MRANIDYLIRATLSLVWQSIKFHSDSTASNVTMFSSGIRPFWHQWPLFVFLLFLAARWRPQVMIEVLKRDPVSVPDYTVEVPDSQTFRYCSNKMNPFSKNVNCFTQIFFVLAQIVQSKHFSNFRFHDKDNPLRSILFIYFFSFGKVCKSSIYLLRARQHSSLRQIKWKGKILALFVVCRILISVEIESLSIWQRC